MREFLQLARNAELNTRLNARRSMNRALHLFSSREVALMTPVQLQRLYDAAEDYILDPANNVPHVP